MDSARPCSVQHPLTGGESGSVIWEWGHYIFDIDAAERKWIPQPRRLLFPFSAPPATPARPRGGASPEGGRVGSRCMQRHCRWRRCCRLRCYRFRDSVAVSCIAACCASLPAEHCRPSGSASLQLRFIRALPPCSQHCAGCGGRHSQLARGSTPRQAGLARLCQSQNLSSASGLAIGVATPPTVSCQSHCCVRIASSSTTSATKYLQQPTFTACTRFDP